ncbi:MAG: UDP-N-acetylglucosamine 1-carboxyvinyltransferase [Clostridia bacterium]|nr:UDP-N-acetylglucosamine 1-carboxyvinyltransferase [Clostridia bacterium]
MDKFLITGGTPLRGEVTISGAKNAAVAIIPAAILSDGICRIENIPNIADVNIICKILYQMGAGVRMINEHTMEIDPSTIRTGCVPYELTRKIRASYYLIGAMLGKYGFADVSMPGGCDFGGVRPIDQHIRGFEALGAEVTVDGGRVIARSDGLIGNSVYLDTVSVGTTVNLMLAAVRARGRTIIENAAKEPHIVDLANFLNSMGADIRGAGTDVIKVRGVQHLDGTTYSIIPDQIEAGTFMVATAATGGDVMINNVIPKHLESITKKLQDAGAIVEEFDDSIRVRRPGRLVRCNVKTMPHPGFPTDMQPQFAAMLSIAEGTSIVTEGVWDNRYKYVSELSRMGAQITVDGKMAVIEGVKELNAAPVKVTDLRAGAALMIAGLVAKGVTEVEEIYSIERGYETIDVKLNSLGADIRRVSGLVAETAKAE